MGDPRLKMTDNLFGLDRGASRRRQHDQHFILGEFARYRDRRGLAHRGMAEQLHFDFIRRNILAAAADRVLEAVNEVVVAVTVAEEGVSGVKPAVAPGVRSRLRVGVVSVIHGPWCFGAQDHLPDLAVLYSAVMLIDQSHLDARAWPSANIIFRRIGAGN